MNHFEQIISYIHKKHIFIQTHNFPDPDAVASALGLQMLLKHKGITSTICYKGCIEGTIADKLVHLLDIEIIEMSDMKNLSKEAEIILVDSQKGNSNVIDLPGAEIICIDHHPTYEKAHYEYFDIRPDVGACTSIIASYFFKNKIKMDTRTATALLYGIKIDTANLTRGVSQLDLDMFYKIYPLADHRLIKRLDTSVLKMDDLKAYASAIESIEVSGEICFTNTCNNCPEALIASISDFILAVEDINMVVVYSLREDGIKLSVRSDGFSCNAGNLTNIALKGIGKGGGHEHMAGGFVPFLMCNNPLLYNSDEKEKRIKELFYEIKQRFIEAFESREKNI